MTTKKHIHIFIDIDDYVILQKEKTNISGLCRELIKSYINTEQIETDKDKLINERKKAEDKVQELKKNISIINMQILKIEEEEEKNEKEQLEKAEAMTEAVIRSGMLEDI